jgi:hypothetical protein
VDELLRTVREAASEYYHVYGELGRESDDEVWYLAKDRSSAKLVALRLRRAGTGPDGKPDYDLSVARELDASVAVGAGDCPACHKQIRRWARFCTNCGVDLAAEGQNPSSPGERAVLLEEVRAAAQGVYEVLGEMPWGGGGGVVYFAIEKATQRLMRLRLKQDTGGFELGETRVLMPLGERLAASYVTQEHHAAIPSREVQDPRFTPEELEAGRRAAREAAAEQRSIFAEPPRPEPVQVYPPRPQPVLVRIGGKDYDAVTLLKVMAGVVGVLVALVIVLLLSR